MRISDGSSDVGYSDLCPERFVELYVAYDFTAGMEDELDDVSGGRQEWKALLEAFWRDFKPKSDEVMEKKPSEVTEELDEFLSDYLFPPKDDGTDPPECPKCGEGSKTGRASYRERVWRNVYTSVVAVSLKKTK